MHLLALCFLLCGLARVGAVEMCRAIYPGSECLETCPDNYDEVNRSFPYCYSGYMCCQPKPTTTPPTTTTPEPPPTTTLPPQKQCGINAIAVTGRIVKDQPQRFNEMECAWPWVVSLYTVFDGFSPIKSCNGVLLSKNKFLSVKTCFEFGGSTNAPTATIKAHVGSCNVTEVADSELLEINVPEEIPNSDLVIVDFATAIPDDWNLNLLPVCLPDENTEFRMDQNACIIASRSKDQGIVVSSRVNILERNACDNIRGAQGSQPVGTFCTSTLDGFALGPGDHGGVVMCPDQNNHWTLKGVINAGRFDTEEATNEIIDIEPIGPDLISSVFNEI